MYRTSLEHNNLNNQENNLSNDEKRCSAQKLLFFVKDAYILINREFG